MFSEQAHIFYMLKHFKCPLNTIGRSKTVHIVSLPCHGCKYSAVNCARCEFAVF